MASDTEALTINLFACLVAASGLFLTGTGANAADCIVNAHSTARVGASSSGIISAMHVDRSDRVRAGQLVAELEASREETSEALAKLRAESDTAIEAARRRAETAELKVERITTLKKREIASAAELEEAVLEAKTARLQEEQALLDQAAARLEFKAASNALQRKRIVSPFDGIVTARLMSKGELYNEQGPLLIIARTDPLHVETFLPLSQRDKIELGKDVPVTLETGENVVGKIIVVDAILDAATGTFGVRIELPNLDGKILVGQRCEVDLIAS